MYSTKPYESVAFRRANEVARARDRRARGSAAVADGAARRRRTGGVRVRERRARRRRPHGTGRRRGAPCRAALRRVQQRRPGRGRPARPRRRAGARLLAERGRRAHDRADPGVEPPHPQGVQPRARRQLRPRRPGRLRPRRQDRRRRRHRPDRRARRPPRCGTSGARCSPTIPSSTSRLVALGIGYVGLDELWERSHVVTLNCPLTAETHHLVDADVIARMRSRARCWSTPAGAP